MLGATRYAAQAEISRQTQLAKDIAKLQASVSSGTRLTAPSDDPSASARIADIRQTQADQAVWQRNVNTGTAVAAAVDDSLKSVGSILDRAKELILAGRNDTASESDRSAIATELRGLLGDLNNLSQATDPTGRELYPTGTPLAIPVSESLSVTATATRADIFDSVKATDGTTKSISDIISAAADALEQTDPTQRATDIDTGIDDIDAAITHITIARADQGVRAKRFDDAGDALNTSGTDLTEERSTLESTDLTYALSEFQAKQLSLQAAQTLFAQSAKTTLFSLLS